MHAHSAMMSKDEEVIMAQAFATKVGNSTGAVMDPETELDMGHYDHSRDDKPVVLRVL